MLLSPAELSYLYDSLAKKPMKRPDSRLEFQYRPLEASTSFLPTSNGSARMRSNDGSECIISIKSKVVLISEEPNLLEVDINVPGYRDDSNFISNLKFNISNLMSNFPKDILKLTTKYAYKLYIDCILVSHSSYPLSLISFTCYLALKTARLPLLVSTTDDREIEEQPTFSDDWDSAIPLGELAHINNFQPPIIITVGVVGDNLALDPSIEEEQVVENGLLFTWYNNNIIPPFTNINLTTNSPNSNSRGLNLDLIYKGFALIRQNSSKIVTALDSLIEQEDTYGSQIF